ncbi:MAG: hypothetical protein R3B89_35245 [Polyangiaceae bacterium]
MAEQAGLGLLEAALVLARAVVLLGLVGQGLEELVLVEPREPPEPQHRRRVELAAVVGSPASKGLATLHP